MLSGPRERKGLPPWHRVETKGSGLVGGVLVLFVGLRLTLSPLSLAIAGLLHGLGRIELSDREQTDHLKIVLKTLRLLSKDLNWLSERHFEAARSIQFIIASMYRLGSPVRPHPAAMVVQTAHLVASHLQTDLMDYAKRTLFDSKANPTKPALTKN